MVFFLFLKKILTIDGQGMHYALRALFVTTKTHFSFAFWGCFFPIPYHTFGKLVLGDTFTILLNKKFQF